MDSTSKQITLEDISARLEINISKLSYIIYKIPDNKKYFNFEIPKKNGGKRSISKPVPKLMNVQRKVKDYLLSFYISKPCSHGFEVNRNIKTNAERHLKGKLLLNIDIKDFFGSINFGRIFGLLSNKPFNFDKKAAASIAKLVIYNNSLPQGAPTSPILSNMIARRMDSSLIKLASKSRATYTRYVDDITFSTTYNRFDKNIVDSGNFDEVIVGRMLIQTINKEGFEINHRKTRLLNKYVRKEVTEITINEFPNVRRKYINSIFGMIFSWKKHGYEQSLQIYKVKYLKLNPSSDVSPNLYRSIIIGKISFVAHIRGWDDVVVSKLCRRYCECDSEPPKRIKAIGELSMKYNVFIGHASEQKDDIAKPLFDELTKLGIKTFIDIVEIKWGDSLTKLINKSLAEAEYFLAIISIDSIGKSWPDTEMNAAIARQIDGKQKVLPLFVGTKTQIDECKNHYSLISDKLYKEWNNNPQEVAQEIKDLIS